MLQLKAQIKTFVIKCCQFLQSIWFHKTTNKIHMMTANVLVITNMIPRAFHQLPHLNFQYHIIQTLLFPQLYRGVPETLQLQRAGCGKDSRIWGVEACVLVTTLLFRHHTGIVLWHFKKWILTLIFGGILPQACWIGSSFHKPASAGVLTQDCLRPHRWSWWLSLNFNPVPFRGRPPLHHMTRT